MNEAFITPSNLSWARTRAGYTAEDLAVKAGVPLDKLAAWERGETRPSLRQAEELAGRLHIPIGYLYLSAPPAESPSIPDFRSGYAGRGRAMSLELREVVDSARRRQEAYREIIEEDGAEALPFVSSFDPSGVPGEIAAAMRKALGIAEDFARKSTSWTDQMGRLARKAGEAGILVFRSSIVGGNTHRHLDVDEFRGFALCDDLAPVVFVNAVDYKTAQIFSLARELAHLWIGQSGVSNDAVDGFSRGLDLETEALCDKAAAEFLAPAESFAAEWKRSSEPSVEIQRLAARFRVSSIVALRRALELDLVKRSDFAALLEEARGYRSERDEREEEGGGDFYKTFGARNGERFPAVILGALRGGRLLYREAAELLDVNPGKVVDLDARLALRAG
jgi:Zn-dependent peptidase ImmA (M78 family)/transcriptional regulator with XRE-family HTH domain